MRRSRGLVAVSADPLDPHDLQAIPYPPVIKRTDSKQYVRLPVLLEGAVGEYGDDGHGYQPQHEGGGRESVATDAVSKRQKRGGGG